MRFTCIEKANRTFNVEEPEELIVYDYVRLVSNRSCLNLHAINPAKVKYIPRRCLSACNKRNTGGDRMQSFNTYLSENENIHKRLHKAESTTTPFTQESWFNTWPERCEKPKTEMTSSTVLLQTSKNTPSAIACNNIPRNTNGKCTLEEALKNISLTYSPVTKQLHLAEHRSVERNNTFNNNSCDNSEDKQNEEEEVKNSLIHSEYNQLSLNTTSILCDQSPSGSLLDSEDRSSLSDSENGTKFRKKSFTDFINKNVFSWKSSITTPNTSGSIWKLFGKTCDNKNTNHVVSSTALIPNMRPSNLPAKSEDEEMRHQEEYKAMLAAVKKKETINSFARQKHQKLQLQLEEQQAQSARHFTSTVLNNWDTMCNTRKTRGLWWLGLPSNVRGRVWRLAIGNDLNLTQQLYEICLSRAQSRLNGHETAKPEFDGDQESSMDVIQLDISRTFPHLCIFQEGGPYSDVLHSLLAAYVCYRPDVGYVQGMSYIAAVLILNMEEFDAFVCFANLLNRPLHNSAFTLNQNQMQAYYNAYNELLNYNLPKLYHHFECSGLTPDLYMLDWIYTIFAKAMPLDIASRVWDLFLRDGDEFLFRTALGILHLYQDHLLKMDFLHGAQFLTRLPEDLPVEQLFKSIQTIYTNIGKQSFNQTVEKCCNNISNQQ